LYEVLCTLAKLIEVPQELAIYSLVVEKAEEAIWG
jgi:hypothetical protein